jgi:hypothetical protein
MVKASLMKLTHETDPSHCAIKTLAIGHYKLLIFGNSDVNAAGKRQGIVVRYKIDKNNLEIYDALGPRLAG